MIMPAVSVQAERVFSRIVMLDSQRLFVLLSLLLSLPIKGFPASFPVSGSSFPVLHVCEILSLSLFFAQLRKTIR